MTTPAAMTYLALLGVALTATALIQRGPIDWIMLAPGLAALAVPALYAAVLHAIRDASARRG